MSKTMYDYQAIDIDYFEQNTQAVVSKQQIRCSKAALVESFAGDDSWLLWAKGLRAIKWHNKTENMVGSTRRVEMVGNDAVEETFFKWDPEGDIAFYVTQGSLKPVSIFAERYRFKQIDAEHIELEWTVAIEAKGFAGWSVNLFKPVMRMMFQSWLKHLKKSLEQ